MSAGRLAGRRVAFGVSGGIAAYKALDCLRLLTEAGAEVRTLMTPEATRFVSPLTFEALSDHPVTTDWLRPQEGGEPHIRLASWAEVLAIVPATANTIAKLALGLADEIVSGTALATQAPLVLAPAMNDKMFTHPQTADHLRRLRERGAAIVEPAVGRLASGATGIGRLAAPERTVAVIEAVLQGRRTMDGVRVVVSAGGTREALDPVRYLGNFSSGKMGRAIAGVAAARGAQVTLVSTVPSGLEGIEEIGVTSAADMLAALQRACATADVLVMAAAVADYAPTEVAPRKVHRSEQPIDLHLRPNVDVLKAIGARPGLFRVGFAAETDNLRQQAQQKLAAKQLDMIVANEVGADDQGLGSDFNAVTIVTAAGAVREVPRAPKWEVAGCLWDAIEADRDRRR